MIDKLSDEEKLFEVIEIVEDLKFKTKLALGNSLTLNDKAESLAPELSKLTEELEMRNIEMCFLVNNLMRVLNS